MAALTEQVARVGCEGSETDSSRNTRGINLISTFWPAKMKYRWLEIILEDEMKKTTVSKAGKFHDDMVFRVAH